VNLLARDRAALFCSCASQGRVRLDVHPCCPGMSVIAVWVRMPMIPVATMLDSLNVRPAGFAPP
jgi:hypothetical protein